MITGTFGGVMSNEVLVAAVIFVSWLAGIALGIRIGDWIYKEE